MKMFENNSEREDIAILMNLISQLRDGAGEEAGVMDDATKIEYGVDDIVRYIRGKYGENL